MAPLSTYPTHNKKHTARHNLASAVPNAAALHSVKKYPLHKLSRRSSPQHSTITMASSSHTMIEISSSDSEDGQQEVPDVSAEITMREISFGISNS
jgi:hypothetical protein